MHIKWTFRLSFQLLEVWVPSVLSPGIVQVIFWWFWYNILALVVSDSHSFSLSSYSEKRAILNQENIRQQIAHFRYSDWATVHKTTEDKAPGKSKNITNIDCFLGALFSIVLCMVGQPEHWKWAIDKISGMIIAMKKRLVPHMKKAQHICVILCFESVVLWNLVL